MTLPPERVKLTEAERQQAQQDRAAIQADIDAMRKMVDTRAYADRLTRMLRTIDALTAQVQAKDTEIARLKYEIDTRIMAERSILKQLSKIGESNEPSL